MFRWLAFELPHQSSGHPSESWLEHGLLPHQSHSPHVPLRFRGHLRCRPALFPVFWPNHHQRLSEQWNIQPHGPEVSHQTWSQTTAFIPLAFLERVPSGAAYIEPLRVPNMGSSSLVLIIFYELNSSWTVEKSIEVNIPLNMTIFKMLYRTFRVKNAMAVYTEPHWTFISKSVWGVSVEETLSTPFVIEGKTRWESLYCDVGLRKNSQKFWSSFK